MSRARWTLRVVVPAFSVITVGVLARADAPPDQYDNFDLADTVITDAHTYLRWQRTVTTQTDFPGAVAACNGLSLGTFPSGWRLPSYKELLTLVDESPHYEYENGQMQVAIDGNAFPGTPVSNNGGYYWTSSASGTTNVFVVEFHQGNANTQISSGSSAYVRCVHDPP